MNDLLVAPIHVLCVAGPDAGKAFVPTPAGVTLGRESDVNVRDRETSRGHLFIRLVSTRRGELVEVQDRGSSNGFATGRWVAPAPGFGRNWARVKKVKSGGGSALLGPGSVFLVGSNLWEVKARPVSFDLKTAVQYDGSERSVGRRSWMFLLPLISVVWLLARFLGGAAALAFAGLLLAVAVYTWFAIRSRRRPQPRWGIIYGLGLPPRGASFQTDATSSDGFESGADGHSGPFTDGFGPHGPALVGAAPFVAGRPTVTGHSLSTRGEDWIKGASRHRHSACLSTRGEDWIIDFSPAPTLKRIRVPTPIGTFLLVIPKFRRGDSIHTQPPVDIALHDGTGWTEWVLAQALIHARLAGIAAYIQPETPSILRDDSENPLLTVQPTPGAADHIIQCPPSVPLQVQTPKVSRRKERGLPSRVLVNELPDPAKASNSGAKTGLRVPIGMSEGGVASLDIVADGPHALVAGTTGSGKSEALRTWIAQMCRARGPRALRLVLIDYKGGAAFRDLTGLPHLEGLLTDLDSGNTARAIAGLSCELTKREEALAAKGWASLDDWEKRDPTTAPARIVCVIDEFRAMIRTHPDTLDDLVDLAARGRSLGMHLIAATQSPGGVVTPAMRANLTLRICLRTADASDSMEVLGTATAAELPRIPGRAIVDAGAPVVVQWAYSDNEANPAGNTTNAARDTTNPAGNTTNSARDSACTVIGTDISMNRAPNITGGAVTSATETANGPGKTAPVVKGPTSAAKGHPPSSTWNHGEQAATPTLWRPALPELIPEDSVPSLLSRKTLAVTATDPQPSPFSAMNSLLSSPGSPVIATDPHPSHPVSVMNGPSPHPSPPVFAIADNIANREYLPLTIGSAPITIVGPANRRAAALAAAAHASHALVINTAEVEINNAAHALDAARWAGRAVVIDDLGEFLRGTESWGMGAGQSWWRDFLRRHHAGLVVGVESSDYGLVRSWSRALLSMPASQARAIALPRDAAELCRDRFVTYPWDGQLPAQVSVISFEGGARESADCVPYRTREEIERSPMGKPLMGEAHLIEPLAASSSILVELQQRVKDGAREKGRSEADLRARWEKFERVDVLGKLEPEIVEVLKRAALDVGADFKQVNEIELVAGGYRCRRGVVTVLGEVPTHALRALKLPPYIRADSAEYSATWVGFCDVWYRLFPL